MSRSKSIQSKYFKLVGVVAIAAVGVIGLIRCVPSDQAVVTDETVSEKVKEAEAAEEAEALAMKEAHGSDSHHGKATKTAKADKNDKPAKAAKAEKAAKHETAHEPAHHAAHAPAHKAERQPASVAATTHGAGSLYIVQVGAFKVKENAEKLTAKLKDAGFPVRLQSMTHSKSGELHLVRFEPTPNKAEAQDAIAKLEAKESMKASLLAVPAGS